MLDAQAFAALTDAMAGAGARIGGGRGSREPPDDDTLGEAQAKIARHTRLVEAQTGGRLSKPLEWRFGV